MNRKTLHVDRLTTPERRRFLKWMGVALASPFIPDTLRYAVEELAVNTAYAQSNQSPMGTLFVEIDLRDQWDQGHVFVAPGLATHSGLRRGDSGDEAALYFSPSELVQRPGNVYLTGDSMALDPHLDTIAMIDACEPSLGAIHGHEAANAIRSPGRGYNRRSGTMAMYENDPVSNFPQGCEEFYTSTPTPACLHNYQQKLLDPTLRNGFAFKGITRSIHTVYHFGAGLPGAELDRFRSRQDLYSAYPAFTEDLNVIPSSKEVEALTQLISRVDGRYLSQRRLQQQTIAGHQQNLREAGGRLFVQEPRTVSVPLTPEETAFWSANVPGQICTRDDTESFVCNDSGVKGQIWEQAAWAFKILSNGLSRTAAIEFDYMDLHQFRPEVAVRTQAQQISRTLARLIQSFKDTGLYNRTLIAVYTADGSRSPAANSYGHNGKNTLMLAGGMIRGGYFGDIRVDGDRGNGHRFSWHAPDLDTGAPRSSGSTNWSTSDGRIPSARVWRTVTKALGIPDSLANSFPDVQGARPLDFMLRS